MENLSKIHIALCNVQSKLKPILKESDNSFFRSKYVDLASACDVILPLLSSNELSITQEGSFDNGTFILKTTLRHNSGEQIVSLWPVLSKDNGPQALGSASSYARRYSLMALVGASALDDDGEAAEGRTNVQKPAVSTEAIKSTTYMEPKINIDPKNPISPGDFLIPFGKTKGCMLKTLQLSDIKSAMEWASQKGKFLEFVKNASEYIRECELIMSSKINSSDMMPAFDPNDNIPY